MSYACTSLKIYKFEMTKKYVNFAVILGDSNTWFHISITIFMIFSLVLLQTAFISWADRYWFELVDIHLYKYLSLECSEVWWKMGIKKVGNNKYHCVAIRHCIWNNLFLLVRNNYVFYFLFKLHVMFLCVSVLLTPFPLHLQVVFCFVANMEFLDNSSSGISTSLF